MKVYSYSIPLQSNLVDAFCVLQEEFTDQFVYYRKDSPVRYMGLGRCIAVSAMDEVEYECEGPVLQPPVFFGFERFDAENPAPADELFQAFPQLHFLLPEVVLIQNDQGTCLQVNSLGPVYEGRVNRFMRQCGNPPQRGRTHIDYSLERDSRQDWNVAVQGALDAIATGRLGKVVLSRRLKLSAEKPFSSRDVLVNLIDGPARGTVFMYRYGDVFFCGCTPELLVRKHDDVIESMCLAGTIGVGQSPEERRRLAEALLADEKNLREHAFVVDFMRGVMNHNCYDVRIPNTPEILSLQHVQHLHTPVSARMMQGRSLQNLAGQLHPTPALSGAPVGEAMMLIRQLESFNRGLFGGTAGVVDAQGNGECSVAIRSGVFDGYGGYVYAGCGIVADSDADAEYDEIDMKLQTILSAFDAAASE